MLYVLLAASLCGCSRYVEGDVFLDKNANNVRDFGESVVSGMPFTVTRNASALKTGVTDAVGHFLVPVDSTDIGSNYCVQVSSADVAAMYVVPTGDSKALAIVNATPAPTPQATADACPTIVGHPDCDNA
ncbi:MAG: hypothetical protein K8R69_02125, partial [Deltaproteobacteria bacterium]|nr:hypothetical protein [Deltaproteobacteria bacterium]